MNSVLKIEITYIFIPNHLHAHNQEKDIITYFLIPKEIIQSLGISEV